MQQTREIFWSIGPAGIAVFYAIGIAAMAIFAWGFVRHLLKYGRGRRLVRPIDIGAGLSRMLIDIASHRMLRRRDRWGGAMHHLVLAGFLIATAGTTVIFIDYDIVRPLLGESRWRGVYYLGTSLLLDLGHLGLIAGLIYLIVRRIAFRLPKLSYIRAYRGETDIRPAARNWRIEDYAFLLSLLAIELTGFFQEGLRLRMDQPGLDDLSPIGAAVARLLGVAGMSAETVGTIRLNNWWLHGALALAFTAAIPWYKAKHVVAVVGSLALRDDKPLARLPRERNSADPGVAAAVGLENISDLTWKEMLQLDACTKCGRCHEACPAQQSNRPLSPRDLVLDLRTLNDQAQGRDLGESSLISGVIGAETLWACMSCGACQEICPVGIEQPPLIVQMRRHLVDRDVMDPQLRTTFGAIAQTGNSFGEPSRKRPKWAQDLGFPVKDIRHEAADILWFVGDYASFDPRNQQVSRTVATLLRRAGVDFALLHESEWNAGNDVRRAGEEGLYEMLVEHNLAAMHEAKRFERIITTDPHSYNTIRNEYPDFGEVAPIDHYSTLLLELIDSGRLAVTKLLGKRVTFHDPCHLGRLNKGYDPPRQVLAAIGCTLVEMPRNRDNSFCCGAGGGRIWIPDTPGTAKPAISRMHEAAALGQIDVFVTCCPKDLTMYEDARKTSGHENSFVVSDLAELVAQATAQPEELARHLPTLFERLVDVVAERVGAAVDARLADAIARLPQPTAPAIAGPAPAPMPVTAPTLERAPVVDMPPPSADDATATAVLAPMGWDDLKPLRPAALPPHAIPAKQGLRILVTVKHVGMLGDEHPFAPGGRDVLPSALDHGMNEWDDAAVEEALRIVEKQGGGEVVVVTVGDDGAEASLRKALAKGASRAVRVWSTELAGADPLTVARLLAGIAAAEQPDLILSGVQSSDQANGATGVALARVLDLPFAAVAIHVEWSGAGDMVVTRELEGGLRERVALPTPAVIAVQSGINVPRYATMRMIKDAKHKPLDVVDAAGALDGAGGYVVRRMFVPEVRKAEMLSSDPAAAAAFIAELIRKKTKS